MEGEQAVVEDQAEVEEVETDEEESQEEYEMQSVDNTGSEEEESDDEDEDEEDSDDDEDDEGEDDSDVEEEVELKSGKKIVVPKEVKESMMMHKDYTQKTQVLSEQRNTQLQREEQFHEIAQRQQMNFTALSELATLDKQLEDYKKVDWVALAQQDPLLAQQHQQYSHSLSEQRQELVKNLEHSEAQQKQQQQQFRNTNLQQTVDGLKSSIEGYSPQVGQKIGEHALTKLGVSKETLEALNNGMLPPSVAIPFIKAVNDSMKLAETLKKQTKVLKKKPNKPLDIAPKPKAKGRSKSKPNVYSKNLTPEQRIKMYQK
jgi:hypothetical protein